MVQPILGLHSVTLQLAIKLAVVPLWKCCDVMTMQPYRLGTFSILAHVHVQHNAQCLQHTHLLLNVFLRRTPHDPGQQVMHGLVKTVAERVVNSIPPP